MTQEEIAISQAELDMVLKGVRSDNEQNAEKIVGQRSAAISQAELDLLLGTSNSTVVKIEPKVEPEKKELTMEEKIATRKARAAALLAQVNAQSPKRISVVYGSTLTTGEKISYFKKGTVIELDREPGSDVDILCDGKLIAKGVIGNKDGKTAVQITFMIEPQ